MAKYRDRQSMGRSEIVPRKRNEHWKERHARRMFVALDCEGSLREWCKSTGLTLSVKNDGHHWIVRSETINVEWWPSTAKAVAGWNNARYRHGIHCHDVEQLKVIVAEQIRRNEQRSQKGSCDGKDD